MDNPPLLDVVIAAIAAGVTVLVLTVAERVDPRRASTFLAGHGARIREETLVDPISGLDSRQAWNDVLHREEDRLARYGQTVTVMVAELDGLDAFAAALGRNVADCLIGPVAAALHRNARASDVIASTEYGRFVALLPETSEVAATNYIERARAECDTWLQACAVEIRLAVGWAQPVAGEHLADAIRLAELRMNADRRRYDFRAAPSSGSPDIRDREPASPFRPLRSAATADTPRRLGSWVPGSASGEVARETAARDGPYRRQG